MVKYDTKSLTAKLGEINAQGWIEEHRKGNQGSAGNTLEDLLGVKENNLKLPDAGEWELKTHKYGSSALLTLFHSEPKPRNTSLVERYLVPKFGWPRKSGKGLSFRQTLTAQKYTNRGFKIDTSEDDMLKLKFKVNEITSDQDDYRNLLRERFGNYSISIDPQYQPYWELADLEIAMNRKLKNTFFVDYKERKGKNGKEFRYDKITKLTNINARNYFDLLNCGIAYIDFDARTGKNHGTKFRIKSHKFANLFDQQEVFYNRE